MSKNSLTDMGIRQLPLPKNGRLELRDSKTPGLWLRVTKSGNKSFVVRGYIANKPARITLGQYPLLSLRDARSQALAIVGQMRQGIDPRKGEHNKRKTFTFVQVLDDYAKYMRRNGEATGKPSEAYRREVDRLLRKEFGEAFGTRDIREISKTDIMDVIYRILDRPRKSGGSKIAEESPSAANHALSYVKTLFAWSESQGRIDNDITRRLMSPAPKNKRDRVLNDEELKAVWSAAFEMGYPYAPAAHKKPARSVSVNASLHNYKLRSARNHFSHRCINETLRHELWLVCRTSWNARLMARVGGPVTSTPFRMAIRIADRPHYPYKLRGRQATWQPLSPLWAQSTRNPNSCHC